MLLENHDLEHAVQTVTQVFFQNRSYKRVESVPNSGLTVKSSFDSGVFSAIIYEDGAEVCFYATKNTETQKNTKAAATQAAARAIYYALSEYTGYSPPWGTLTGVRPAKLLTEGHPPEYLKDAYLVRDDKIALTAEISAAEREFLAETGKDDIGVYIGVPFCPTRCGYCSFASYPLPAYGGLRDEYLQALRKEMEFLADALKGRNITAVYIGGGTPTALEPSMLERLLRLIRESFAGSYEFTAEAGRPDSLDSEKLLMMKEYGVNRLCLNPQTTKDETLKAIGRNHKAADFFKAFEAARIAGFDNINADIIIGLPGEGPADIAKTLKDLEKLGPEAITAHTLAIKRASEFNLEFGRFGDIALDAAHMEQMLALASEKCREMGLRPYYMYRQKNMVGNFENVGYSRPGTQSIYNHMTMTEKRSIYAAGCGAVTKIINHETNKIRRAFNLRNLTEYIGRIDEMIERKRELL